jgi:DNA-binding NtrC family response regulator
MNSAPHLLIVDDDATLRLLLQAHFTSRGISCETAAGGEEALRIIDQRLVHVLVTDLEMPGMDGIALLRAVRERGLATRCVVLTGYATTGNLIACLREGACELVAKPLTDRAPLDGAVDRALAQMQRWQAQMHAIIHMRPDHAG